MKKYFININKNIENIYLNIVKLPSFCILSFLIISILILDKIKEYNSLFYYSCLISIFLIGSIIIVFTKINKFENIRFGLLFVFLFFCLIVYITPFQMKSYYHIRNFLGLENKIEKIEYRIVSYPMAKNQKGSIFSCRAQVEEIFLLNTSIKASGKVNLTIYNPHLNLSMNDKITSTILPKYQSERFLNKGRINIQDVLLNVYIDSKSILKIEKSINPLYTHLQAIRQYVINILDKTLSPELSILGRAMLLGDRAQLNYDTYNLFSVTNTSHLLAISGLHLGIIIMGFSALLKFIGLSKKLRVIILIPVILIFLLLIGNKPGIIRATMTFLFGLIAFDIFNRKKNYLNILFLSGTIILVFEPSSLFNMGYQLSFLSVFSILFFFAPINKLINEKINYYKRNYLLKVLINIFISLPMLTLIIQIVTFPIIMFNFKEIYLLGFISNALVVPIFTLFLFSILFLLIFSILPDVLLGLLSSLPEVLGRVFYNLIKVLSNLNLSIKLNENNANLLVILWLLFLLILFGLVVILPNKKDNVV